MPAIYDLKPQFQQLLAPLVHGLHARGASANGVTVAALLASIMYGTWMALAPSDRLPFCLLPVFMLVRMALNAIDGMLARQYRQQSRLGALLNEIGDVVSDCALYLPFALIPGVHPVLVTAVVLLAVLTEFVGVLGQVVGPARRYDGPLGKSDRAFCFGALGSAICLEMPVAPYADAALALMVVLLAWTIANRARQALTA